MTAKVTNKMTKITENTPPKAPRCQRCSKRLRRRSLQDSMAQLKDGRVDHLVCPGCLTDEEHIGMLVREAMTQVGITHDGRILTRPNFK